MDNMEKILLDTQRESIERCVKLIDILIENEEKKNIQNNITNRFRIISLSVVISIFILSYFFSSYSYQEDVNKNINENINIEQKK